MNQGTGDLSVYQARVQDWYEDAAFWQDMSAYVSDWSQELYGDVRAQAPASRSMPARLAERLPPAPGDARAGRTAAGDRRTRFLESASARSATPRGHTTRRSGGQRYPST